MNSLEMLPKLSDICKQSGIAYLGMFGSRARNEEKFGSDVDLLVRYDKNSKVKTLLDHLRVQNLFSEALNETVDLVEEVSLKPDIRSYVLKDLKSIYGEKSEGIS